MMPFPIVMYCIPQGGFIAFVFPGAFSFDKAGELPDKIECLQFDRNGVCLTKYVHFWRTKWVGGNNNHFKKLHLY